MTIKAATEGHSLIPWLRSIEVKGFQGNRRIKVEFDRYINFLIGRNGAGKTTLIHLINAAVARDFAQLSQCSFNEIRADFECERKADSYSIIYQKLKESPYDLQINCTVLGPRNGKIGEITVRSDFSFHNKFDHLRVAYSKYTDLVDRMLYVKNKIAPNSSWLSIHRSSTHDSSSRDSSPKNSIDLKLEELNTRTTRYLSSLDSRASSRSAEFQKEYFLSLFASKGLNSWQSSLAEFKKLDLDKEKETLTQILRHLKINQNEFETQIDSHFKQAQAVVQKNNNYLLQNALTVAETIRIHELNEKWSKFERDRDMIFAPKREFIAILNEIFINKKMRFSDRNQPEFVIDNQHHISLSDLSSGEKQAYIITCEALLQEGRRFIYLADEPELSLHVDWQETLVSNVLRLNDSCQIIFATHSPDILGAYGNNAINVEHL